jgi:hypothetical protein
MTPRPPMCAMDGAPAGPGCPLHPGPRASREGVECGEHAASEVDVAQTMPPFDALVMSPRPRPHARPNTESTVSRARLLAGRLLVDSLAVGGLLLAPTLEWSAVTTT